MIEIRPINYSSDETYDRCGNTAVAVLEMEGIKILLCDTCLDELNNSLNEFNNTLFCHKCNYFIMSNSGWDYGGSCKKWAATDGKEISENNAGYDYCVDCMKKCRFIKNNTVYKIYADDCGADPCSGSCGTCTCSYWRYSPIQFSDELKDLLGKTVFLTEAEAKEECERLMKRNRDLFDKGYHFTDD